MSMTRRTFFLQTAGTAAAMGVFLLSRPAAAQSAEELKRRGLVGETLQGFLVARDSSVAARVEEINAERRRVYQQRAAQEGLDAGTIGQIYAREIIEASPPGTWYQSSSGMWVQK